MQGQVMRTFFFEITRSGFGRYAWVFVEIRDHRRRVLARSARDYKSRKRVRAAIERLRAAVPGARVVDGTGARFRLPPTRFHYVPGVLPLPVGHPSAGYGVPGYGVPGYYGVPVPPGRGYGGWRTYEETAVAELDADELDAHELDADELDADELDADELVQAEVDADQQVGDRPAKRAADQSAADQSAADQSAADQPAADQQGQPAADERSRPAKRSPGPGRGRGTRATS